MDGAPEPRTETGIFLLILIATIATIEDRSAHQEVTYRLLLPSLRHIAVSLLKDAGVPDAVVMALVGHDSVAMSARYTHVGTDAMRKATETLPEI